MYCIRTEYFQQNEKRKRNENKNEKKKSLCYPAWACLYPKEGFSVSGQENGENPYRMSGLVLF